MVDGRWAPAAISRSPRVGTADRRKTRSNRQVRFPLILDEFRIKALLSSCSLLNTSIRPVAMNLRAFICSLCLLVCIAEALNVTQPPVVVKKFTPTNSKSRKIITRSPINVKTVTPSPINAKQTTFTPRKPKFTTVGSINLKRVTLSPNNLKRVALSPINGKGQ
jgi:hypothetical protein